MPSEEGTAQGLQLMGRSDSTVFTSSYSPKPAHAPETLAGEHSCPYTIVNCGCVKCSDPFSLFGVLSRIPGARQACILAWLHIVEHVSNPMASSVSEELNPLLSLQVMLATQPLKIGLVGLSPRQGPWLIPANTPSLPPTLK